MNKNTARSLHRTLARELNDEEISDVSGGFPKITTGTTHTTDPGSGGDDEDSGLDLEW